VSKDDDREIDRKRIEAEQAAAKQRQDDDAQKERERAERHAAAEADRIKRQRKQGK
jgi:hypothetical protein